MAIPQTLKYDNIELLQSKQEKIRQELFKCLLI